MKKLLNTKYIVTYVILVISVVVILTAINTNRIAHQNRDLIENLRLAQVHNCELSKSPGGIRYIIAQQVKQQIKQSKVTDYAQFFPNIPKAELNSLIRAQVAKEKQEVAQLLRVNCDTLYPKITSP